MTGSYLGGISHYVAQLGGALRQRGHRVACAGARGELQGLFDDSALKWVDAPVGGGPVAWWRASRVLKQYLKDEPVDLIHAHHRQAGIVGRRVARAARVPLLYTIHLPGFPTGGVYRWLSDYGDHTHAVSQGAADWLIQHTSVPASRVTVVPNGVDVSRFSLTDDDQRDAARVGLGLTEAQTVVACVGRFEPQKNMGWVIDAAAVAKDAGESDVRWLLMGDGPEAGTLEEHVKQSGVADCVRLLPWGDPLPAYRAADLLALPSREEGFGLVCAEAMATGVPVLRTQTSGCAEQIVEGVTGWSTPVDEVAWIAEAVKRVSDRDTLRAMREAARQHAVQHLSIEQQIAGVETLYRRLAHNHAICG